MSFLKCPYPDCQKDFNPEWNEDDVEVDATTNSADGDGITIKTRQCRFCKKQFHEIFQTQRITEFGRYKNKIVSLQFTFPSIKTKFIAKLIPVDVTKNFNEAERCKSVGSLTGVGACLRKTIYSICDSLELEGRDYREKISNLPVKGKYQDLLKQIKWLGDFTTKPGDEKYTMGDADLALQILPLIIEEIYSKDEKIVEVEKILAKVNSSK